MADKEKYYIPIEGKLIEVKENVYVAYYKMGRRERYLEEQDAEQGVFSYDALDNGKTVGEESFPDTSVASIEDLVLAKELADQLHRSIAMLPKGERDLIKAIYFEDMTDTEYSKQIAMTQQAVSYQHKRILSKLRFFMNLLTCFCGFFVAGI